MRIDIEPNSGLVTISKPRTFKRATKNRSYTGRNPRRNPYRRRSNGGLVICCTALLAFDLLLIG